MTMRCVAMIALIAATILADSDVLTLTKENYEAAINDNKFLLVEFFAPWCGHCQQLAPEYEKAATALKAANVEATVAKVDCTTDKSVCDEFEVKGYPTLKWFSKKVPIEYPGGRNKDGIVGFIKRFSGPVLTELKTVEDVTNFAKENKVAAVAFLKEHNQKDNVTIAAENMRADVSFGVAPFSILSSVFPSAAQAKAPVILAFVSFQDEPVLFTGKNFSPASIEAFIKSESFPLVDEISPTNYKGYVDRGLPIAWCFLEKADRESFQAELKAPALATKGNLSWVWLDAVDYARHAENMGLGDKWPGVVIDDQNKKQKFLFPAESTFDGVALSKWARDVLKGKIVAFVKSEEIPEDNSAPVVKVVGKNYEAIVLDESKDVMLEFYAPWCGHCQQLAPKYTELAEFFKDEKSIIIAQVDGTANDIPLDVKGFPTIFFFPANKKSEPITYSGGRSMQSLAKFVAENSTTISSKTKESALALKESDEDEGEEQEDGEQAEKEAESDDEKEEL